MSKVVAIDGPAGAGKSTVAKMLAERCGFTYVNTGSLYRAIAWAAAGKNIGIKDLQDDFLNSLDLDYVDGKLLVNGVDPGDELRSSACSAAASFVATQPKVRQFLLPVQRNAAEKCWIVMEGRDIGTVIFPDARKKFFVTASPEERARRRLAQSGEIADGATFASILAEIKERDERDSNRPIAPLKPADDAVIVDTTGLSIDEVVSKLAELCRQP